MGVVGIDVKKSNDIILEVLKIYHHDSSVNMMWHPSILIWVHQFYGDYHHDTMFLHIWVAFIFIIPTTWGMPTKPWLYHVGKSFNHYKETFMESTCLVFGPNPFEQWKKDP